MKEDSIVTGGDHLDAVSTALLPRYREVAAEMAPYRQRTVYEVHPELSFFQINSDQPLRWTKKFEVGGEERRAILVKKIPESIGSSKPNSMMSRSPIYSMPPPCSGRRGRKLPAGTRLPTEPEWDEEGLRMEFVR